jgi:hypothetical protein
MLQKEAAERDARYAQQAIRRREEAEAQRLLADQLSQVAADQADASLNNRELRDITNGVISDSQDAAATGTFLFMRV